MIRPVKASGKFAAAALAAVAWLAAVTPSPAQEPARVAPAAEGPARVVPVEADPKAPAAARAKSKAVLLVPIAQVPAQLAAARIEANHRQIARQLRPILRAEYGLLVSSVELTPDQRRGIALDGAQRLEEVAARMAGGRAGINQPGVGTPINYDPRPPIREAIEAAARVRLAPEAFALYVEQVRRKAEDRREAVVLNLIANIDRLLSLGEPQRVKLRESMLAGWDDRDFPSVEASIVYDSYFPSIPEQHILPILTEDQAKLWNAARKINFSAVRTVNFPLQGAALDLDDAIDDPDLKAALEPEGKR